MATNEQVLQLLAQVELFEGLSKADLRRIYDLSKELTFDTGDPVLAKDRKGGRFYLVIEGEASVDTAAGMRVLGPGDHFGEMSLIDGEPRSVTITAKTPLRTLTIASFNFRPLMLKHPSISQKLLVTMSRRIRDLEGARTT